MHARYATEMSFLPQYHPVSSQRHPFLLHRECHRSITHKCTDISDFCHLCLEKMDFRRFLLTPSNILCWNENRSRANILFIFRFALQKRGTQCVFKQIVYTLSVKFWEVNSTNMCLNLANTVQISMPKIPSPEPFSTKFDCARNEDSSKRSVLTFQICQIFPKI